MTERGVWYVAKGVKARAWLSLLRGASTGSLAGDAIHPPLQGGESGRGAAAGLGRGAFQRCDQSPRPQKFMMHCNGQVEVFSDVVDELPGVASGPIRPPRACTIPAAATMITTKSPVKTYLRIKHL